VTIPLQAMIRDQAPNLERIFRQSRVGARRYRDQPSHLVTT
jgi:hypothetical protein